MTPKPEHEDKAFGLVTDLVDAAVKWGRVTQFTDPPEGMSLKAQVDEAMDAFADALTAAAAQARTAALEDVARIISTLNEPATLGAPADSPDPLARGYRLALADVGRCIGATP